MVLADTGGIVPMRANAPGGWPGRHTPHASAGGFRWWRAFSRWLPGVPFRRAVYWQMRLRLSLRPHCALPQVRGLVVTRKPSPVPARLRILSAWVAAIEQQSRVWLPLSLGGASLADLTVFVPLCGMSVLVFVATVIMVLDWRAQYLWSIFWSVGLPCVACATIALRLRFQNDKSRGWILDFRSRTLTPLGLKRQGTVVLHEGCGLSWEPFGNAKGTMFYCRLVLDPGPAGQRIPLTSLTLQRGSRREQALIDRCLEHLNGRLGLQGVEPRQGR